MDVFNACDRVLLEARLANVDTAKDCMLYWGLSVLARYEIVLYNDSLSIMTI
jgi:hypothetical protein